jgi:hypothetical protein
VQENKFFFPDVADEAETIVKFVEKIGQLTISKYCKSRGYCKPLNFSFLYGAANSGRHAGNMKLNMQNEKQILALGYRIRGLCVCV